MEQSMQLDLKVAVHVYLSILLRLPQINAEKSSVYQAIIIWQQGQIMV